MAQRPNAVSLMLCDQVVFEQETQKPYLLGVFTGRAVEGFPTAPQRFDVFVTLTDGIGKVMMELVVEYLDAGRQVYTRRMAVDFADPLQVINLRFRIRHLTFQEAGIYLFAIKVEDDEIAASRLRVYQTGGPR